jgi:thioredoxin reductase
MPPTPEASASNDRPFPPGDYPVVVVGSGPGALQVSHDLDRLGVRRATISADEAPGGMFRRYPLFQRLLSWTKPHAQVERASRAYEWYDWNSLISDDPSLRAIMPGLMDGSSSFPSRAEMEANLAAFAQRGQVTIRYGCPWESTRQTDDGRFVLTTPDGEYTCRVAIFAIGMAEPWRPPTPGIEAVPHYVEAGPAADYAGKRVLIIGKQNSAFEVATALLATARQIVLTSPRPAQLSVLENSLAGVRARYVQPYEDAMLANGVFLLNAKTDAVERVGDGFRVRLQLVADGQSLTYDADDAIATTGFRVPLRDLPELGVATFAQGKMPSISPFWESVTVPGIFFAGTIGQAASGLRKHGIPSNSGAVHGARYNARVLVRHVARSVFGVELPRPPVAAADLVDFIVDQLTLSPERWNHPAYRARVISFEASEGARDEGILPLAHFVDAGGPDALALTVEADPEARVYPVLYVRRGGDVREHVLDPASLNDYRTPTHRAAVEAILSELA